MLSGDYCIFVVLKRTDYKEKFDNLLNDANKFLTITRNPISKLEIEINEQMKAVNLHQQSSSKVLNLIYGYFKPRCIGQ